ncbi:hypothetical protein BH18ACT4_BH18ACT4_03230 [soil metagenome]
MLFVEVDVVVLVRSVVFVCGHGPQARYPERAERRLPDVPRNVRAVEDSDAEHGSAQPAPNVERGGVGARRPSRRSLSLLLVPIVALSVMGTVANALTPKLLADHPLLLVALEPRNRNLLLTASRVDVVPFVVFATVRRIISDPLFFLLGHFYGEAAVRWIERQSGAGGRLVRLAERMFARAAKISVFLFPGILVCVMAGAVGMRPRVFLALNLAGTIAVVVALRLFAQELDGPVGALQRWNDRNVGWLTAVTVAAVVAWLLVQRVRGRSKIRSVAQIEQELTDPDRDPDKESG